jgi:hypothetical protein
MFLKQFQRTKNFVIFAVFPHNIFAPSVIINVVKFCKYLVTRGRRPQQQQEITQLKAFGED